MSYFYKIPELNRMDSFSPPCIESAFELSVEDLSARMAEIIECEEFLKSIHVTWCRGLVLKGEGAAGDEVDRWCVAVPSSVSVMYWMKSGDGLLKLMYGRPLLIGGEGYVRKERQIPVQPVPVQPARSDQPAQPVQPVQPVQQVQPCSVPVSHPVANRRSEPQARVIEKRVPTRFTGIRSTGIPSLDRVRGIKR